MKIRIRGNSVRIRLSRTEVAQFGENGYLEEKTDFGNSAFAYALQRQPDGNTLSAGFDGGKITMYVPAGMATEWTTTGQVGMESYMNTSNGQSMYLLLEKDFKCIDNSNEDQSDNYENPLHTCD